MWEHPYVCDSSIDPFASSRSCEFTGTLIVLPEPAALAAPGERVQNVSRAQNANRSEGVVGAAREFGQRELNYRLSFLACHVAISADKTSAARAHEEDDEATVLDSFTAEEREDIERMR